MQIFSLQNACIAILHCIYYTRKQINNTQTNINNRNLTGTNNNIKISICLPYFFFFCCNHPNQINTKLKQFNKLNLQYTQLLFIIKLYQMRQTHHKCIHPITTKSIAQYY